MNHVAMFYSLVYFSVINIWFWQCTFYYCHISDNLFASDHSHILKSSSFTTRNETWMYLSETKRSVSPKKHFFRSYTYKINNNESQDGTLWYTSWDFYKQSALLSSVHIHCLQLDRYHGNQLQLLYFMLYI